MMNCGKWSRASLSLSIDLPHSDSSFIIPRSSFLTHGLAGFLSTGTARGMSPSSTISGVSEFWD